jgi:hypothetical protein
MIRTNTFTGLGLLKAFVSQRLILGLMGQNSSAAVRHLRSHLGLRVSSSQAHRKCNMLTDILRSCPHFLQNAALLFFIKNSLPPPISYSFAFHFSYFIITTIIVINRENTMLGVCFILDTSLAYSSTLKM